jgi:hypothetical protein
MLPVSKIFVIWLNQSLMEQKMALNPFLMLQKVFSHQSHLNETTLSVPILFEQLQLYIILRHFISLIA